MCSMLLARGPAPTRAPTRTGASPARGGRARAGREATVRGHKVAPAAAAFLLPLHGVLLPGGSAEGLGHQLWPPALAAAACGDKELAVLRWLRVPVGPGQGLHPAALPWAQWGWGGHSWQLPAPLDFPGRVAIARDPRLVPHGDNGDSPSRSYPGLGAKSSRPRCRQLLEAGWVIEGCRGGAAPLYGGARRGLSPSPFHPVSPFPFSRWGTVPGPPALPSHPPILGNLRPPAPLPRLRA